MASLRTARVRGTASWLGGQGRTFYTLPDWRQGLDKYFSVLPSTYDRTSLDFEWYEHIRRELLRPLVPNGGSVLDIGCRDGSTLLMMASAVATGLGIDLDAAAIDTAARRAQAADVGNLTFLLADAASLPSADCSFDLVLLLGDVLSYSNLFDRTRTVLSEASRVLKPGGRIAVDGGNWEWEYRDSPSWSFLRREPDGSFTFGQANRSASGAETLEQRTVLAGTPLLDWLSRQRWPESTEGYLTTLDIRLTAQIPESWLGTRRVERCRYFTPTSLKSELAEHGFADIKVLCYGLTYDVVNEAGLADRLREKMPALARAEAHVAQRQAAGSGPWLFGVGSRR